jgi:lipoate-protein ligase A
MTTRSNPALPLIVWRDPAPRPGWANMAIDRALPGLAAREGAVFVRLYAWSPHCLSFGRHEPAARRYDRDRLEAEGIDCVRRPTGGRAVWHARELTYAVAAPAAALGGLRPAYHRIHEWLATAISQSPDRDRTIQARAPLQGRGYSIPDST